MTLKINRRDPRLKELQQIPGVGPSIAQDLYDLGINSISDLIGKSPEKLYIDSCVLRGMHIDRCLLYVFRCAVYYASNKKHDPELLKWWYWKDKNQQPKFLKVPDRHRKTQRANVKPLKKAVYFAYTKSL